MKKKLMLLCTMGIWLSSSANSMGFDATKSIDWNENNDIVFIQGQKQCALNVIGGKWVLTRSPCLQVGVTSNNLTKFEILSLNQGTIKAHSLKFLGGEETSLVVAELEEEVNTSKITIFKPKLFDVYEKIQLLDTKNTGNKFAVIEASKSEVKLLGRAGLYGSVFVNGALIGVNAKNLINIESNAEDFDLNSHYIAENINGWNYPTQIKIGGGETLTVTVQSIHRSGPLIYTVDSTVGDVSIVGGTCQNYYSDPISMYGSCTYKLKSTNGKEGKVMLTGDTDEAITVNKMIPVNKPVKTPVHRPFKKPLEAPFQKPVKALVLTPVKQPVHRPLEAPFQKPVKTPVHQPVQKPKVEAPASNEGGSGGSFGIFGLFGLGIMAFLRKKHI